MLGVGNIVRVKLAAPKLTGKDVFVTKDVHLKLRWRAGSNYAAAVCFKAWVKITGLRWDVKFQQDCSAVIEIRK